MRELGQAMPVPPGTHRERHHADNVILGAICPKLELGLSLLQVRQCDEIRLGVRQCAQLAFDASAN
jgi:hypothetical protein